MGSDLKKRKKTSSTKKVSSVKKDVPRNGNPRVPRERYTRVEQRLIRLEQRLEIRELGTAKKKKKNTADWMTEEELLDLERRVKRIQKKLEISDDYL